MARTNCSFYELAELAEHLSQTKSRLKLARLIGDFLKSLKPPEIPKAVELILGQVSRSLELSFAAVLKMVSELAPISKNSFAKAADVGEAVQKIIQRTKPKEPTLRLAEVYQCFVEIAQTRGQGSRKKKEALLKELFSRATDLEAKYITKIVIGEMRHGVSEGMVQDAIARTTGVDLKIIQRAYMLSGDLGRVAQMALEQGDVSTIRLKLFQPLKPMLAQTTKSIRTALEELKGSLALEYKYDGARVQIHKENNRVKIFSRHLTDISRALPDVVSEIERNIKTANAILEGEVIGVDAKGRPLPFQQVMRRLVRVKEIEKMVHTIPVKLLLFDCLFCDNELLIDLPYKERWQQLEKIRGTIPLADRIIPKDLNQGERFLAQALADGHEGLMAKALESPYASGVRGKFWLKIKPSHTLDLVIVAADWGYGRRHNWLSNYHLAAWDEEKREFSMVGKTFKGLTDEEFSCITKELLDLKITEKRGTVYVQPKLVVEVAFNEIQKSPHCPSGMALRFARITRIRDDKSPEGIATIRELKKIYEHQFIAKGKVFNG